MTVGVIGAGAWGSALAAVAARAGNTVRLWARSPDIAEAINKTRRNEAYLPDLGKILGSIRRLVNLEMQAKGIELEIEIDQDPLLAGNESMLQQILLNLVINAYQAIEGKGRNKVESGQSTVQPGQVSSHALDLDRPT